MTKAVKRTTILFLLISVIASWCCAEGSNPYIAGGSDGIPNSSRRCNVGDKADISGIFCPHGMVQVTPQGFKDCNATNPVATFADQTFLCEKPGDFYFICNLPYLCHDVGQRFQLRVGQDEPKNPASVHAPVSEHAPVSPPPSPVSGTPQARSSPASGTPQARPVAFPASGSSQTSYMQKLGLFVSFLYFVIAYC